MDLAPSACADGPVGTSDHGPSRDLWIRTRSLLGANEALYQVELQAHVNIKGKT